MCVYVYGCVDVYMYVCRCVCMCMWTSMCRPTIQRLSVNQVAANTNESRLVDKCFLADWRLDSTGKSIVRTESKAALATLA